MAQGQPEKFHRYMLTRAPVLDDPGFCLASSAFTSPVAMDGKVEFG